MHELAPKVPRAGAVHKSIYLSVRVVAVVLVSLLTVAVSGKPVEAAGNPLNPVGLPNSWTAADVGAPAVRGSASDAACSNPTACPVFSISGAGLGIGGSSDQFMFLYQRLTGDGVVVMRLQTLAGTPTVEAGLMIRESLSAGARHGALLMGGAGQTFRTRSMTGGTTGSIPAASGSWLRLERIGPAITASVSDDGSQWSVVATQALDLPATAYVGIVVTSRVSTSLATATVSGMSVSSTTPTMPSGWTSLDVGSASVTGSASYANGGFVAASAGAGFGGPADGFRFIYTRVRGDARLATRVVASQGAMGRQAGIALRTSLEAGAVAAALVADETGLVLLSRAGPDQTPVKSRLMNTTAPVMLQLDRRGSMVAVAFSMDGGATWKTAATLSSSLGTELYAGLVVAGGPAGDLAAAAFDRLSLVSVPANRPPEVSLSSPVTGQTFVQGNPVAIIAAATDPDDLVARVDFRVNGVTIASDSTAPYLATWAPGGAGAYSIVAVASDFDGAVTESSPVLVTVVTPNLNPTTPETGQSPGGSGSGSNPGESPSNPGESPSNPGQSPSSPGQSPGGSDPGSSPGPSTDTKPWQLIFDASADHAKVEYYALNIYNTQTRVLVAARSIGKPSPAADGTCTVDVNALVTGLVPGLYDAVVQAVGSAGSSDSSAYTFNK